MATAVPPKLGDSWPVLALAATVGLMVASVWVVVDAGQPTAGRANDVAVYTPVAEQTRPDIFSGQLQRTGGCTYLVADSGTRVVVVFADLGVEWSDGGLLVGESLLPIDRPIDLQGWLDKDAPPGAVADVPPGCDLNVPEVFIRTR